MQHRHILNMRLTLSIVLLFVTVGTITAPPPATPPEPPPPEAVYHVPEINPPKDRCGYLDPEFPYALTKLSGYRRILTIIHGAIMVWIFIFFIPNSIFPVLWHRLAPNRLVGREKTKEWMRTHMMYTYPIYPLMVTSVLCALIAQHDTRDILPNSACFFYNEFHELLGVLCFLVYTFQFFMGFFVRESLQNDVYKSLRFYHSISNVFGYLLSIPLMAMARVANEEGAKRYLYIVPYFYFFFSQINMHIRMKFADFGALNWHMSTEDEIANDNRGVMLRTSQWLWNFGFPSKGYDSHLLDLKPQRSISRIRLQQYLDTYRYYWRRARLVSLVISVLMTVHLGLLYSGIFLASANYFPAWSCLGDFRANWSLLEIYAL